MHASLMWRLNPGFDDRTLQSALDELRSGQIGRDLDDPWARTLALKLGVDGGVEAGYYRESYLFADDPTSPRGKPSLSQENFEAFCVEAARLGWQVGAHCVGDAAIDATLSAFEAANQAAPIVGLVLLFDGPRRPKTRRGGRRLEPLRAVPRRLGAGSGRGRRRLRRHVPAAGDRASCSTMGSCQAR